MKTVLISADAHAIWSDAPTAQLAQAKVDAIGCVPQHWEAIRQKEFILGGGTRYIEVSLPVEAPADISADEALRIGTIEGYWRATDPLDHAA